MLSRCPEFRRESDDRACGAKATRAPLIGSRHAGRSGQKFD
jgi:hypothetical protein